VPAILTNDNLPRKLGWIRIPVGVVYNSDLESVEKATLATAIDTIKEMYGTKNMPEPVVRSREFGDSGINLSVRLPIKEYVDQFKLRYLFIKALHKKCDQESIEIPFPIRTIRMAEREKSDGQIIN